MCRIREKEENLCDFKRRIELMINELYAKIFHCHHSFSYLLLLEKLIGGGARINLSGAFRSTILEFRTRAGGGNVKHVDVDDVDGGAGGDRVRRYCG